MESFCIHSPAHASFYCRREAVLACPSFPPWNLPSFTVEFTLSSVCSRSDPLLSRQGAALAPLDSLPALMIWYSGLTALFVFLLARVALAYLPTALFGTEATFSFSASPVCSSFSAEAYAILHALCWSRKHHQVCHFFSLLILSDTRSVLTTLSCLHFFFYLKIFGRSGRNCLLSPSVLSGYNESLDTRFSLGTMRVMSWPDGERYLHPLESLVISLFISRIYSSPFSEGVG